MFKKPQQFLDPDSQEFQHFLYNTRPQEKKQVTQQLEKTEKKKVIKLKKKIDTKLNQDDDRIATQREQQQVQVQVENPKKKTVDKLDMNPVDLINQSKKYQFGNYHKYYIFRDGAKWDDPRIKVLNTEIFKNARVLDIGCNEGSITLQIALRYDVKMIRGIDVDYTLINKAVDNMVQFEKKLHKRQKDLPQLGLTQQQKLEKQMEERIKKLPSCFIKQIKQKLKVPDDEILNQVQEPNPNFPNNIYFRVENFISFKTFNEIYDVILCFSVTKWIHLNFGDQGIHRLFQRVSQIINPGGYFILEAQPWKSYKKKKCLTPEFKKTYASIELKPEDFHLCLATYGLQLVSQILPDTIDAIQKTKSTFKRTIQIYQMDLIKLFFSE